MGEFCDMTLAALNVGAEMVYGNRSSKNIHFFILLESGG
jgi:hypothetical protein